MDNLHSDAKSSRAPEHAAGFARGERFVDPLQAKMTPPPWNLGAMP
jgi:hypothetical protein